MDPLVTSITVPLRFVVGLVATLLLYGLVVGGFLFVVLPRSRVVDLRVPRIRRAWAIAAGAYVLVLAVVTNVGTALL